MRHLIPIVVCGYISLFGGVAHPQAVSEVQQPTPLAGVTIIQVDPTVVGNPKKVKDPNAATLIADTLTHALKSANFAVGDSRVHAHMVLNQLTGGSFAKRFTVGFGAGRSVVDAQLIIQDATGKTIVSQHIQTRGDAKFAGYEGNKTQQRQALSGFQRKLADELERLK